MGSLSRLIHNSKTCFSVLFTNHWRWQKWSSSGSDSVSRSVFPWHLRQQSEIKKFVHTTIDSIERQPRVLCSQNISGNSSFRHFLMKSLQVFKILNTSCCQHLGLIIKIFQAVPGFHKNWNACAPDPAVATQRQVTKNCLSVTKLIRLFLFFWRKNESRFNEENDKVNPFS